MTTKLLPECNTQARGQLSDARRVSIFVGMSVPPPEDDARSGRDDEAPRDSRKEPRRGGGTGGSGGGAPGPGPIIRTPPVTRADPGVVADRLTGLAHDLAGLLDAALRQVSLLARESPRPEDDPTAVRLRGVHVALEQMAHLVTAAARGMSVSGGAEGASVVGGGPWSRRVPVLSLGDALQHAVSIMEPVCAEHHIALSSQVDSALEQVDARGLYTVIVNALRNAVESIDALPRTSRRARKIEVVGKALPVAGGYDEPGAVVHVRDSGAGLPIAPAGQRTPDPFERGFTTKPGALGIGLSLARDIVTSAGGTIVLGPRDGAPGAELTINLPPRRHSPARLIGRGPEAGAA